MSTKTKKISKEQLEEAVRLSTSMREVVLRLGSPKSGASFTNLRRLVHLHGLDTSHFRAFYPEGYRSVGSLEERFLQDFSRTRDRRVPSYDLRRALLSTGRPFVCVECGVGNTWNNKILKLEIDHTNGNALDCREENLQFICPNCHSQKPIVYRNTSSMSEEERKVLLELLAEKQKRALERQLASAVRSLRSKPTEDVAPKQARKKVESLPCELCSKPVKNRSSNKTSLCFACYSVQSKPKKANWPADADVAALLANHPAVYVASLIGVSDAALRKHAKKRNIWIHRGRGSWAKREKEQRLNSQTT